MKSLLKLFFLTIILCCNNLFAADLEVTLNLGKTIYQELHTFKAKDGGEGHPANTTVKLAKNPKSADVIGINSTLFFKENLGFNLGVTNIQHEIPTAIATITNGDYGTASILFPKFNANITVMHFGLKLQTQGKVNLFTGLNLQLGVAQLNNTRFAMDATYGQGGKETMAFVYGAMLQAGANVKFGTSIFGIEYRVNPLYIADTNQQFRSFNKGFTGGMNQQMILFSVGHNFKI